MTSDVIRSRFYLLLVVLFSAELNFLAHIIPAEFPHSMQWISTNLRGLLGPATFDSRCWTETLLPVTLILTVILSVLLAQAKTGPLFKGLRGLERLYAASPIPIRCATLAIHVVCLFLSFRCAEALLSGVPFLERFGWPSDYFFASWFGILSLISFFYFYSINTNVCRRIIPRLSFAFILSAIMIYVGLRVSVHVWPSLSRFTLTGSAWLLDLCSKGAKLDPKHFVIGWHNFRIRVASECSGIEGVVVYSLFLLSFFAAFREELLFPRALLLFPLGVGVMLLSNVVRIALLVAMGAVVSTSAAFNGFHSAVGWIFFDLMGLATAVLALHSGWLTKKPRSLIPLRDNLAASFLLPLVGVLAVQFFSKPFTFTLDLLYPARVIIVVIALYCARPALEYFSVRRFPVEAIVWGAIAFVLWMMLDPTHGGPVVQRPWVHYPSVAAALWLGFRLIGSLVTTPIAEELAFRGYLLRRLVSTDFELVPSGTFTLFSCVLSSALFGMMHSRTLAGMAAGLCFCGALYYRKKLSDAVVAHMTTNAMLAIFAFTTGRWGAWL
jgi:exosortase E/protease (VPEID-CTERM system)